MASYGLAIVQEVAMAPTRLRRIVLMNFIIRRLVDILQCPIHFARASRANFDQGKYFGKGLT